MTPCEKIGLKVGDEIRLTKEGSECSDVNTEELIVLDRDDGSNCPYFRVKSSGISVCLLIDGFGTETAWFEMTQTEAEKRGAKFGTMGVLKETGERCVWIAESLVLPGHWEIDVEGKAVRCHRRPEEIRLDHEPEFKEVRFNEATHEQRMVVENLRDEWGQEVSDIFWSKKESIYIILLRNGATDTTSPAHGRYKVRIPN